MPRKLSDERSTKKYRTDQFNHYSRRFNWPYCLTRHNNQWVILNRDYKPLNIYVVDIKRDIDGPGFTSGWLDYGPFAVDLPKLTDAVAQQLCFKEYDGKGTIFLYNDDCKPESSAVTRRAYIKKLELLSDVIRKEGDDREWKEMFNGEPEISFFDCKRYKESA